MSRMMGVTGSSRRGWVERLKRPPTRAVFMWPRLATAMVHMAAVVVGTTATVAAMSEGSDGGCCALKGGKRGCGEGGRLKKQLTPSFFVRGEVEGHGLARVKQRLWLLEATTAACLGSPSSLLLRPPLGSRHPRTTMAVLPSQKKSQKGMTMATTKGFTGGAAVTSVQWRRWQKPRILERSRRKRRAVLVLTRPRLVTKVSGSTAITTTTWTIIGALLLQRARALAEAKVGGRAKHSLKKKRSSLLETGA
jgi:hypothetical protein